jgi:glutamine phosphoribosylpyrophosphate amidotransferase
MSRRGELIAARHQGNVLKIKEELGAASLAYLSSRGLKEAITGDPDARGFCMGCMTGHSYPIDKYGNEIASKKKSNVLKKEKVTKIIKRVPSQPYIHEHI